MTASSFRSELERAWTDVGFRRAGRSYRRDGPGVVTLVAIEKGFGDQRFISVGFWLDALGVDVPDRVERCHAYFRLERLVPEFREVILAAGALGSAEQPHSLEQLLQLLRGPIDVSLRAVGTADGLREAMHAGRLAHGMVRKEARTHLDGAPTNRVNGTH